MGGFAEMFVATWLEAGSGTEATLAPFYNGPVDLTGVAPQGLYASRTAAVHTDAERGGCWAVTVAADVLEQHDRGYEAAGVRYYQVGVARDPDGNLATTGLPAEVSAPRRGDPPALAAGPLDAPDRSDRLVLAAEGFLRALLVGDSDVSRFESPGVDIPPVKPAPLRSVTVTGVAEWGSGPSRHAVMAVQSRTLAGQTQVLQYQLGFRLRAGRWEVDELTGAPTLARSGMPKAPSRPDAGGALGRSPTSLTPSPPS